MSKCMYKDYNGKRITCKDAFKSYKVMEISFDYDITRLNLEHIANVEIKDIDKLNQFNEYLDELINLFSHKIKHQRYFRVKRWDYMIDIFRKMNDLLELTEEEMTERALDFALEYDNREELMELGLRQLEVINL